LTAQFAAMPAPDGRKTVEPPYRRVHDGHTEALTGSMKHHVARCGKQLAPACGLRILRGIGQ
jgi:hypothetical protein